MSETKINEKTSDIYNDLSLRIDILDTKIKKLFLLKKDIRETIANYMQSEGCDCCRDSEKHNESKKRLAKLLSVPQYSDGSGYDFNKFATNPIGS